VCISVSGPWAVIPAGGARSARYHLSCPDDHYAGGLDARVSERAIDVAFLGLMGSPVAGGVSTRRAVTFAGSYTGRIPHATSFRPFLGCAPSTGGGSRTSTGRKAQVQPARPSTSLGVRNVRIVPGSTATLRHSCMRTERLVSSSHVVAFWLKVPPTREQMSSVRAQRTASGSAIVVSVDAKALRGRARVDVQIHAVCAPVSQR
jgi:hypothetical protein